MKITRRSLVSGVAAAPVLGSLPAMSVAAATTVAEDRFDPWIEVEGAALRHNAKAIAKLAGGRPILAVIKNNAYGLGLTTVAPILDSMPEISGFAVVKTAEAIALRDAGISKPVLLLARFAGSDGEELARRGIEFSLCTEDSGTRLHRVAERAGTRPKAHFYIDTGMSRMGLPYHRALPVMQRASELGIEIRGTLTGLTESADFDPVQLRRFRELAGTAGEAGIDLGLLHAASSHALFNFPEAYLDQVRPGIALFGAYPSDTAAASAPATLRPAVRLRARVVRVEQLRKGDSVSYGGNYVASQPTWIATIPVGHTDGVPRSAVDAARILINGTTYPVIGAVSASHTIVEVGDTERVAIGDVATLLGPDDPAIHPNAVASATGTSVYDRLMHLNPTLPKVVV